MRYFLDTEFDGFGGPLISLALAAEDGSSLYLATDCPTPTEWVRDNVMPIITVPGADPLPVEADQFGPLIAVFLRRDPNPIIVADWPDDIRYFCAALITGPGLMVNIPGCKFEMVRVDAYPTDLPGAVQHNALWDARALMRRLMPGAAQ
ncbi:MAG: hypothetical protein KAY22_19425 [Rhizorhabdus sp.]|uniref:hypothetical protein n=1 Tax=Rhizorhabdus sp. TaxID=1968843 RepID=UPI001B6AC6C9|nr:hypothetical protein [Rhizorhabdus sp.]MBP8234469.1 hypothetical protein [Rhizorhabdus sp.]